MNTAVKYMMQSGALTQDKVVSKEENLVLFLPELRILFLIIIVFISGLGLVYIKDLNRHLYIQNQKMMDNFSQLMVEKNKLLLEQSSWAKQDRVQNIAEAQFSMQIPSVKEVVILNKA